MYYYKDFYFKPVLRVVSLVVNTVKKKIIVLEPQITISISLVGSLVKSIKIVLLFFFI